MKTRKASCCSPQPEVRSIVHVRLVAVVDLAAQQLGQGEPAGHWPMREEYWGHVTAVHQPQLTWWTWCRSCWAPRRWRAWWCWRRGPAAAWRAGRAPWSPTRRCWWGTWSRVTCHVSRSGDMSPAWHWSRCLQSQQRHGTIDRDFPIILSAVRAGVPSYSDCKRCLTMLGQSFGLFYSMSIIICCTQKIFSY